MMIVGLLVGMLALLAAVIWRFLDVLIEMKRVMAMMFSAFDSLAAILRDMAHVVASDSGGGNDDGSKVQPGGGGDPPAPPAGRRRRSYDGRRRPVQPAVEAILDNQLESIPLSDSDEDGSTMDCGHVRTSSRGSNQHITIRRCLDCGEVVLWRRNL